MDHDRLSIPSGGSPPAPGGERPLRLPAQARALELRPARFFAVLRRARPYLMFLLAWGLLDAVVSARFPEREAPLWYLIPSLDVVVLLAGYTLLARRGVRVPLPVHVALVAALIFVRLFRLADGIELRYLFRPFNLWVDSQLAPDLWRLLYATMPRTLLYALTAGTVLAIASLSMFTSIALRYAEAFLRERRHAAFFAGTVALFVAISPFWRPEKHTERYFGAFAASVVPRLAEEADFILHIYGYRAEKLADIRRVQDALSRTPSDLKKLDGANVLLFVIESYGVTAFAQQRLALQLEPLYRRFESDLERRGFASASSVLDSPTYAGGSWLAHATLGTGVRTANQFQHSLLAAARPQTIAGFFREAGYRTVLVQPGTTQNLPHEEFHRFEHRYYAWMFDYRGPRFGYAPMPDQYVIDFLHRRELSQKPRRRFIEYALVSTHFSWSEHAPIVDDWSSIGDGSIFTGLPKIRFTETWHDPADAARGYIHSIVYDMEVLRRYLVERIHDDSLVIIVGDHQPAPEVTLQNPDTGVPIHVISRKHEFVDAFAARGYTRGMRPVLDAPRAGMEHFLPAFLEDFSTPPH